MLVQFVQELRHVPAVSPEEKQVDGESRDQNGRADHGVAGVVYELGDHQQVAYKGEKGGHRNGELYGALDVGPGEPPYTSAGDRDGHGEPVNERVVVNQDIDVVPPRVHESHQAQQ